MPAVPLSQVAVHLRPEDNIAVASRNLQPDLEVQHEDGTLTLGRRVGLGHKIALRRIKKGEAVLVALHSANRDDNAMPGARQLDVTQTQARAEAIPFGSGAHMCIGMQLALVEGEIAMRLLWETLPNLRLAYKDSDVQMQPTFAMAAVHSLVCYRESEHAEA